MIPIYPLDLRPNKAMQTFPAPTSYLGTRCISHALLNPQQPRARENAYFRKATDACALCISIKLHVASYAFFTTRLI